MLKHLFPVLRTAFALLWLAVACSLLFAQQPPPQEGVLPVKPALLCLGNGGPEWPAAKKLAADLGADIALLNYSQLTWEKLATFNAVILFDMSRLNADTRNDTAVEISTAGFKRVSDLLLRFVNEGGGLYIYGVSFTHMGDSWSNQTLNQFLKPLNAVIPFEMTRDEPREKRQEGGGQVLYALADQITPHPATAGVKNLWYAVGPFSYGPWTRPLKLSPEWTPLIRTSPNANFTPIDPKKGWGTAAEGVKSEIADKSAPIYAVRTLGKGRIVLSGGESTISFFGYAYSEFADQWWGRIGMEAGLNGVKSDGLRLLESSLKWLIEPSVTGKQLGGYVPPPVKPFTPKVAQSVKWPAATPGGEYKYYKGVFCAMPALGGGAGSVTDWVQAAKARSLDYLVLAGDFTKMEKAAWEQMVNECTLVTTPDFIATPALITVDDQENRFLQCGAKSWPQPDRLSKKDPKRVQDHLGYWMNDANFPLRAPFLFSKGQYPAWLHSGYDTFAVHTYEDNKLVDDNLPGFLQNQEQGDRSRIITMTVLKNPAELAAVKEFTYVMDRNFIQPQFHGGGISYVSSGPRVLAWRIDNATRNTFGDSFVPGTERWRALLRVVSDVPLKSVTIYDSTRVFRKFTVTGASCDLSFDGLHDTRRTLTAVIEDINGGRAITGACETLDALMVQFFCSDRCNIMGGMSTLRLADGHTKVVASTSMLYKTGRLYFGTVTNDEGLPGIDGSGGGAQLSWYPNFYLTADGGKSEEHEPLHQINRPYENADCIIFDTPILKRAKAYSTEIYGHAPYLDLLDPKVDARLVQYHFYRKPVYPSPAMGEMTMTVTDPDGVQMKAGWNGFSFRYAGAWGTIKQWAVVRADGTRIEGPSADEKTGTNWRGELHPGDFLLFPAIGEGTYVLNGDLAVVLECTPSKGWFRAYCGRFDTPKLEKGARASVRILNVKMLGTGEGAFTEWKSFRDLYGIAGGKPAYTATATQGTITSSRYLLELAAKDYGFSGAISKAELPQRLPVKVSGLNEKWTAAKVDLERKQWFPLGVWQGAAYTTVNTKEGDHTLYLGNLLTTDNPDVTLTLLPANADGITYVEIHNPTDKDLTVTVNVPVSTFLAAKQSVQAAVGRTSSERIALK
ncbi:MAG: hypothetical protein ACYDBB_20075 [Armatimonadota bacterium]